MFGIGFSELAVLVIVVLVMIRPEDMPAFFRKMGRLYAQAKKAYKEVADVKDEFLREIDINAAIQDADKPQRPAPVAPDAKTPALDATPASGAEASAPEPESPIAESPPDKPEEPKV
jgi:Sec-independent protein translocase protein TatA